MFSIMASTSASVTLAAGFSIASASGGLILISGNTSKCAAYLRSVSGPSVNRLDARAAGRTQLLLADRLDERAAHQIAHDLRAHLLAELLGDDRQRGLARTEALQARGARELLETLLHLLGHFSGGNRNFQASRQTAGVGQRNFHQFNPSAPGNPVTGNPVTI